jgi:lipopolysaccharide/colanic/teichoic acid biosynthesis glycosyltransferase
MDRVTAGAPQTARDQQIVDIRGPDPILIDTAMYTRQVGRYERTLKPLIDRVGALVLLILFLPVMLATAAVIRAEMGGPVLIRQSRVGRGGQLFVFYKFRTMIPDRRAESQPFDGEDRRLRHKTEDDPRITTVGGALRRLSLDELPQFWNVVKGDMSLVGPRPELPEIVAGYESWQHRRHAVKPGITCRWQISERGNRLLHEATELDIEYIERISLWEDLRILLWTPVVMFGLRSGF